MDDALLGGAVFAGVNGVKVGLDFAGAARQGRQISIAADQLFPTSQATAEAGQPEEVVLRFARGGTIRGSVYGPDGAPIAGARVMGYCRDARQSAADETGPDGGFELAQVAKTKSVKAGLLVKLHFDEVDELGGETTVKIQQVWQFVRAHDAAFGDEDE